MSNEHGPDSKLVLRAESIAQALELREPNWDDFERRVTEGLASAPSSDDALFAAPLPELEEERRARAEAEPRETVSLADLARATVAKRAENDAANMMKESLALASQKRAQQERNAERKPVPVEKPPAVAAVPAVAAAAAKAAEAEPVKAPAARPTTFDSRGPWIGVTIAAVGLAASFALYFAGQRRTETVIVTQPAATSAPAAPVAPEPKLAEAPKPAAPEGGERAGGEAAATPSAEAVAALDPQLNQPSAPGAAPKAERPPASPGKPSAGAGKAATPERVVLDEERPAAPATPTKPELRPAELKPTEGISDRPSTGAAQAAVGAVLGAARACLAGQTSPSSATLVFGSDGEVDSVRVTGAAAGTPAASCVESALKKARVQPFAAPSFSLGVTVRPL